MDDFVFGLEVDFTLGRFDKEHNSGSIEYLTVPGQFFTIKSSLTSNWMASVRPRLGYAFDRSLVYVSGGPAFSEFRYRFTFTDTNGPEFTRVDKTKLNVGWTFGAGYEYAFSDDWRLKADFSYYSFENVVGERESSLRNTPADGFTHKVDYQTGNFRMGLYKAF